MASKMDLKPLLAKTAKLIRRHISLVIYGIFAGYLVAIGYFVYVNIYQTVISPKPIDPGEIIAKRQKVKLDLFQKITDEIQKKHQVPPSLFTTKDPFKQ